MGRVSLARRSGLDLRSLFPAAVLGALVLIVPASFAQKRPESMHGPSVAVWPPIYDAPESEFGGTESCRSCHKNEVMEFGKTSHFEIVFPGKEYIQGCEACHGPGKAHGDAVQAAHGDDALVAKALQEHPVFAFKASAEENVGRCLGCHTSSKQQDFFRHSEHMAHGVSCNECHAAHLVEEVKDASKGDLAYPQGYFFQLPRMADETRWLHNSLLKDAEPALCFGCHRAVQAKFAMPEHHRVPEGLMKCSDCHSPHGTPNHASLTHSGSETCIRCHVEKHGPFVYEHPAVSVEGCVTCHNPHGSDSRMLLVRREGRQLCLECHTGYRGGPQVPHSRLGFQTSGECTRCHVEIHGSNLDPNFLR